jgi:predicted acetyltransferase
MLPFAMPCTLSSMVNDEEVTLDLASLSDAGLLANLLQLYLHDLSDTFPSIELGVDGRFLYEKLPLYWSEPERRFPLLIRYGGGVVGFALITRGSPASENPEVFDIAEFFVIRRYRRSSVGRRAAFLLWNRFPGWWTVRVSEGNATALPFWTGVIAEYTGGTAEQFTRPGSPHAWRVFSFVSPQGVTG